MREDRHKSCGKGGAERFTAGEDLSHPCSTDRSIGTQRPQQRRHGGQHRHLASIRIHGFRREFWRQQEARAGHQTEKADPDSKYERERQRNNYDIVLGELQKAREDLKFPILTPRGR